METDPSCGHDARWRPALPELLRGAGIAVLVGVFIGLLSEAGSRPMELQHLAWSGLAGLLIYAFATGFMVLALPSLRRLGRLQRAAALTGLFFAAGALSAAVVLGILLRLNRGALEPLALLALWPSLLLTGTIAVIVGSAFWIYEELREKLTESVSRLKEAEFAEKELELARSIQRRLLPPAALSGPGYRLAARNEPAQWVAGDFYDAFPLPDGALGLVVADVAGKGIGASLVMASVKAVVPLLAAGRSVEGTLEAVNEKLVGELARREFVALCFARFDPRSGEVELANAGLPEPYVLRSGGVAETISSGGGHLPLGLRPRVAYRSRRFTLEPGERLLLYTDGLPEAPGPRGEPLGYERLDHILGDLALQNGGPEGWLAGFFARVEAEASAELDDDRTALLLERL